MTIETRPLDPEESAGLGGHREWIGALLADAGIVYKFAGTRTDLPQLQAILDNGPYSEDPIAEVFALGTVFGDVLAAELKFEWVVLDDDAGSDFALQHQVRSVYLFPHDAILKRIEKGENVAFEGLFSALAAEVTQQLGSSDVGRH